MAYQNYQSIQPITGDAIASTTPSKGYYAGFNAITSLPTPGTNGNLTGLLSDKFGRLITLPQGPRDMTESISSTQINTTSAITVLAPKGAAIYTDITSVTFTNTSGYGTEVVLSDGTNGYYWYVPANDSRGAVFNVPLAAKTVNTAWTVSCWSSNSIVWVTVQYVYNK